jgi:hypothetical protein
MKLFNIIILLLFGCKLFAQEEFVPPPAKLVTTISFTLLTGGIVILHATLDDFKDTLNFVLDTGSGGISLDSLTSANSFLRRYIIALDYDNLQMKVFTPGSYKYPKGGSLLKPKFSNLPQQMVSVRDNTETLSQFYYDIGAGLCLLMTEEFVKDNSIFKTKRKSYLTQAEGLGGKTDMALSVVKEIKVGPYRFHNVPVYVFPDSYNVISYPDQAGLLGNDLMRRFNTVLNYPLQEIYIKPNKHYLDSFDYSYTGLGFYLIDGAITVTDVIQGSPAEKAGFKEGDIMLGVETNFSNNIQAYKIMLQNAKAKVRVVIMRNGQPHVIDIKVKSIL